MMTLTLEGGARRVARNALGLIAVLVTLFSSTPALAAQFACTPVETTAFANRVHVKCSQAFNDGGSFIRFFAVSTSDQHQANRFLSQATTALVAGHRLILHYTPGDTSGSSFGCGASDCRRAWGVAVLQ